MMIENNSVELLMDDDEIYLAQWELGLLVWIWTDFRGLPEKCKGTQLYSKQLS